MLHQIRRYVDPLLSGEEMKEGLIQKQLGRQGSSTIQLERMFRLF